MRSGLTGALTLVCLGCAPCVVSAAAPPEEACFRAIDRNDSHAARAACKSYFAAPLPEDPKAQRRWARASSDYAWVLHSDARFAEALPYLTQALAWRENAEGPDSVDVASLLDQLALTQRELKKFKDAEANARRALDIRERFYGPNHLQVARSLNTLGIVLRDQGKYLAARTYYRRSRSVYETLLGPESGDVASELNNEAGLFVREKKYEEAETLYRRSIAIRQKLGPSPELGTELYNLGNCYREQRRHVDSEPYFRASLEVRDKVLSADHPEIALTAGSLGVALDNMGRYEQAIPVLQRALGLREKRFGANSLLVAEVLYYLSRSEAHIGHKAEAEAGYERALKIWEVRGDEDRLVAPSLEALAHLHEDRKDLAGAQSYFERAIDVRTKVYGANDMTVGIALGNLALVLWNSGQPKVAEERFLESLRIAKASSNERSVATTTYNLGVFYRAFGRPDEAVSFAEEGLRRREALLGAKHPETAEAVYSLALAYRDVGRCGEADEMLDRAREIARDARPYDEKKFDELDQEERDLLKYCRVRAA